MINGHGYPACHYRRDCHKASKLVHVCDEYDALRTKRPYRDAWEAERVLTYIEERAGTEFEPDAATAFVRMMRKVERGVQLSPLPPANGAGPSTPPVDEKAGPSTPPVDEKGGPLPTPAGAPPKPPEGQV